MKIKKFVNKYFDYSDTFVEKELWTLYKYKSLVIVAESLPTTFEDFCEFELQKGDRVKLAKETRDLGNSRYINIDEIGEVKGVGSALKGNIEGLLGETFTLEDLEVNSDSIKGLGPATLDRIKEMF